MAAEELIGFRERMKAKGQNIRGSDNWNKTTPLSQWRGVTTNNSGDMVGLDLSGKWLDAVNYAREYCRYVDRMLQWIYMQLQ